MSHVEIVSKQHAVPCAQIKMSTACWAMECQALNYPWSVYFIDLFFLLRLVAWFMWESAVLWLSSKLEIYHPFWLLVTETRTIRSFPRGRDRCFLNTAVLERWEILPKIHAFLQGLCCSFVQHWQHEESVFLLNPTLGGLAVFLPELTFSGGCLPVLSKNRIHILIVFHCFSLLPQNQNWFLSILSTGTALLFNGIV